MPWGIWQGSAGGTRGRSAVKRKIYTYHNPTGLRRPAKVLPEEDMARDGMVIISTKRRLVPVEDDYDQYYPDATSERVMRDSHNVLDDSACIHFNSRKEDRRLLSDITDKMNDLDMSSVKPGFDIKTKTGFHRVLYGKSLPRATSEGWELRRQRDLRYPWNYTIDSVFRPSRKARRTKKDIEAEPKGVYDKGAWTPSREIEGRMATDRLGRCFDDKGKPFTHALTYRQQTPAEEYVKLPKKEINMEDLEEEFKCYGVAKLPPKRPVLMPIYYVDGDSEEEEEPEPPRRRERQMSVPPPVIHQELPTTRDVALENLVRSVFSPRDTDTEFQQVMRKSARAISESKAPAPVKVTYNKPSPGKPKGGTHQRVVSKVVRTSVKPKSKPILKVKVKSSKPSPQPVAEQGSGGYRRRRRPRVSRSLSPTPVVKPQPPPTQKLQGRVVKKLHNAAVDHAIRRANEALDHYVKRELEMPEPPARKSTYVKSYAHLRKPGKKSPSRRQVSLSPPRTPAPVSVKTTTKKDYDVDPILRQQRKGIELLSLRSKLAAIEDPTWPLETYKSLRSQATYARNRLDEHKSLVDRYLPPDVGPSTDVDYEVDRKYGELAYRYKVGMPELQGNLRRYTYGNPYAASSPKVSRAQSVPPIPLSSTPSKPAGASRSGGYVQVPRPAMSEARRRAREVLCKTKGDPTYFS